MYNKDRTENTKIIAMNLVWRRTVEFPTRYVVGAVYPKKKSLKDFNNQSLGTLQ